MTAQIDDAQSLDRRQVLPPRSLGDLLNETFVIYGNHFWRFVAIVALVQVPVVVLSELSNGEVAAYVVIGVTGAVTITCLFGAAMFAVGQHYVTGEVKIRACYSRVWWRIVSLLGLGIIITGLFFVGLIYAYTIVVSMVVMAALVYCSVAVPCVIFEGYKPIAALKRSFSLVQGSWWRVFGITLVIGLVAIGLGLLLNIPFLGLASVAAPGEATVLSRALLGLGSATTAVAVPPVVAIAITLLYYDLRVRKEAYDLAALSRELGAAPA